MALNYIWIGFFVIAFVFGIISLLMGDTTIFEKMMNSTFDSSKNAFETSIGLTGVLTLWFRNHEDWRKGWCCQRSCTYAQPFLLKTLP